MAKVKISGNVKDWKRILSLHTIYDCESTVKLLRDSKKIETYVVDPTHVTMGHLIYWPKEIKKERISEIAFAYGKAYYWVNRLPKSSIIEFLWKPETPSMLTAYNDSYSVSRYVPIYDLGSIGELKYPELAFTGEFKIPYKTLKELVKIFGDSESIKFEIGEGEVVVSSRFDTELRNKMRISCPTAGKGSCYYSMWEIQKKMMKVLKEFSPDTIHISMKDNSPMQWMAKGDNYELTLLLAPRMEEV